MKQELFTTNVASKSRNYFFNIKQSQRGDYYLVINQSKKSDDGYERQSLIIFSDQLPAFYDAFGQCKHKLSELDPSMSWDILAISSGLAQQSQDASANTNTQQISSNTQTQRKDRYRQMSDEEIIEAQKMNQKEGRPKNSGLRWNTEDRSMVKKFFLRGEAITDIATTLGRSNPSITAELKKQGLIVTEEKSAAQANPF